MKIITNVKLVDGQLVVTEQEAHLHLEMSEGGIERSYSLGFGEPIDRPIESTLDKAEPGNWVDISEHSNSNRLFDECVRLGVDPAIAAGWPDEKRGKFIRENGGLVFEGTVATVAANRRPSEHPQEHKVKEGDTIRVNGLNGLYRVAKGGTDKDPDELWRSFDNEKYPRFHLIEP